MKPTLKQIFDFGLEVVEKNKYVTAKNKEYIHTRFAKRYYRDVIMYSCFIWFNYSIVEITNYLNVSKNYVHGSIFRVKKNKYKQEQAEELFNSLIYIYDKSFIEFRGKILKNFRKENRMNRKETKFEEWLINRLYKVENK